MQNDLPDNKFINVDLGYMDCMLMPYIWSVRMLTHRPGYVRVFCVAVDAQGTPHPLAPRTVLDQQITR